MMAKRSRAGFRTIRVDTSLALGALASLDVIGANIMTNNFDRDVFVISSDLMCSLRGNTAGDGPLEIGLAQEYTDAEIEECLEATPEFTSDPIQTEKSRRKVRSIGMFPGLNTEEVLKNGEPVRTKCRFTVGNGYNIKLWAYNRDGSTRATGGAVAISGNLYVRAL